MLTPVFRVVSQVTPYMFHHADDDVLQEIGVASPQHRKFILDYIRQHRGSGASDPKPKPTPAHRSPSTKQRDPAREAQKEATRAMLEAKRAELAQVQQEAARRKQLADDLVGDDASTRQAARKEAHIRVTDSPATAAQRRRISQQEALDSTYPHPPPPSHFTAAPPLLYNPPPPHTCYVRLT
jgi:hypothetical protein